MLYKAQLKLEITETQKRETKEITAHKFTTNVLKLFKRISFLLYISYYKKLETF